ncbi:hypothetical protein HUU62_07520 [Rhodoferax sp. 4810]|nr:hypothetical protein [Rhodoferax jenense]
MNNTLHTSSVMNSFKALWQWLMAKPGQPLPTPAQRASHLCPAGLSSPADATDPIRNQSRQSAVITQQAMPSRAVRVLQVMDAGQSPAQSGRLRISGRMADVCAELDRLAAREALQH